MSEMIFCRGCGKELHRSARMCPNCGATFGGKKSRVAAILLALFLGGIGGHKFYLGQPVQGILYFLLCWTFIPAFIAFIELIIYICTSDEDFARKYG